MRIRMFYTVAGLFALLLMATAIITPRLYVHNYSNPTPARPYNGCTLIHEADLPLYLRGEGDPKIVEIVQLAARRIKEENLDMKELHSYVTWAAAQKHVPISWDRKEGG